MISSVIRGTANLISAISARRSRLVGQENAWARSGRARVAMSPNSRHSLRASPTLRGISGENATRRSVVVSVPPPSCS